jgi:hypothetical protein
MSNDVKPENARQHLEQVCQEIDRRLGQMEEHAEDVADNLEKKREEMHATNSPPRTFQVVTGVTEEPGKQSAS